MTKVLIKICFSTLLILLLSGTHNLAYGQDMVSGRVVDPNGEGVIGAFVQLKGNNSGGGAITDLNGYFSLEAPLGSTLIITSIGFATAEVEVNVSEGIHVVLRESNELLDGVVVVGYGSMRRSDLTGSLTTMRPDENDASKAVSLDNLLSGKIAGLVVSSSSAIAGAASSVQIRGASSLRGDNQPLYVIDNVPQASTGEFASSGISGDFQINEDPLSALNPSDIESITVLKDASSTAIYGSRGANGVILITTKKGTAGTARVNASANFTLAEASKYLEMADLYEYAAYRNSRVSNGQYQFYVVGDEVRYVFSSNVASYDAGNPSTYNVIDYRNWQREIYRVAFSQNYSVSVSGGDRKITYYVSANFKDIDGIVRNTGIQQGDLRANVGVELGPKVYMNVVLNGSIRQNNMMAGGNTLGGSTTAVSRTALDSAPFQMPDDDPDYTGQARTTVTSWLTDYEDIANNKTFNASLDLRWQITDNLSYNLRTGGNLNTNERKRWYGLELWQGMNNNGLLNITMVNKNNITVENMLNYNKEFSEVFRLDATAGVTYDQYKYTSQVTTGTQFSTYDLREDGMHMAGLINYQMPNQSDYQILSYLGRVNLSFLNKYLLTASIRADGSSKFAKGNRWGYFPSASIAWRIEQEGFMSQATWVDQLKMRLSYGQTGNQSISPYATFSTYEGNTTYYGDGSGGTLSTLTISNLPNNGLTWEKTASWNLGLDFSFFKTRLNGTIDLYDKTTTDLLILRDLPGSAGFSSTYYNQGSLVNRGIEFTLEAVIVDSKDWNWSVSGNIGINRSRIADLGLSSTTFGCLGERVGYYGNTLGDHFGVGNIFLEGEAPGLLYGLVTQGIVQESDITSEGVRYIKADGSYGYYTDVNGTTPVAGDVKFVDQDGDGSITTDDRTIIGDPNPGFTYGLQTSLSWKNLTLSASFIGVQDRDVINTNIRYSMPSQSSGNITKAAYNGMWTAENPSNSYPSSTYTLWNGMVYDLYVEDASYLRCSDITLNYVFPKKWMNKIKFRNISVYATITNAFIITKYSGYDPEVNSFAFDGLRPGIDMSSYPTPRQYILGLKVGF